MVGEPGCCGNEVTGTGCDYSPGVQLVGGGVAHAIGGDRVSAGYHEGGGTGVSDDVECQVLLAGWSASVVATNTLHDRFGQWPLV